MHMHIPSILLIKKETKTSSPDPSIYSCHSRQPGPHAGTLQCSVQLQQRHAIAQRLWFWCARHVEAVQGPASYFLPQACKHSLPRSPVDISCRRFTELTVSTLTGRALDRLASGIPSSTKGKTVHTKGRRNYYYENSLTCFPSSSLFSTTSTLLPRMYFGYEHCGDSEL
jgi:hypothetical protein